MFWPGSAPATSRDNELIKRDSTERYFLPFYPVNDKELGDFKGLRHCYRPSFDLLSVFEEYVNITLSFSSLFNVLKAKFLTKMERKNNNFIITKLSYFAEGLVK
jgi:hypothetical protein